MDKSKQKTNSNPKIKVMRLHNDKAYLLIDEFLPATYSRIAYQKLNGKYAISTIRKVKQKFVVNPEILKCLVEISIDNKKNIEFFKQL